MLNREAVDYLQAGIEVAEKSVHRFAISLTVEGFLIQMVERTFAPKGKTPPKPRTGKMLVDWKSIDFNPDRNLLEEEVINLERMVTDGQ